VLREHVPLGGSAQVGLALQRGQPAARARHQPVARVRERLVDEADVVPRLLCQCALLRRVVRVLAVERD
jgi:hypothetical protein